MSRRLFALLLAGGTLLYGDDLKKERPQPPPSTKEEIPPEEDETLSVKEYSFNPLQSEKEIRVGNYYFKRGKFRAAAMRFREATKWNNGNSEAWLRLGEAAEKDKDADVEKEAFAKYLELAPDAKDAPEIRKKIAKLK
jgi:tetratricopeptide (TPR) repeat protein